MKQYVLSVKDLCLDFFTLDGRVRALHGVSFDVPEGEIFGLIGETGCGKTVTCLTIMRLLPTNAFVPRGSVLFQGEEVLTKDEDEMNSIRGRKIAMIFQDPFASLNPLFTVQEQITRAIRVHRGVSKNQASEIAMETMSQLALPDPKSLLKRYPHELSGGMKQRVLIAMAVSVRPSLIIADEPTSALDVTTQFQLLNLLKKIRKDQKVSIMLITHNMGVVAETCDSMAVMYAGSMVEIGTVQQVLWRPAHPYTIGLLSALPDPTKRESRLGAIAGMLPQLTERPLGCAFNPRCPFVEDICRHDEPGMFQARDGHLAKCHFLSKVELEVYGHTGS